MSKTNESQTFAPDPAFVAQANASDPSIYAQAAADPEAWWASWADKLDWFEPYGTVCEFEAPNAKWFLGGKLNACYNCVDRHAAVDPNRRAIVFEGEPGDVRTITYGELKDEVSRIANALKSLGVQKGDRVCLYLPMVPELAMTMLACARIGAAHTVVFGGFSADAVHERANDAGAKLIVTADGGWRRGKPVPLLDIVKEAMEKGCPTVERVLVMKRTGHCDFSWGNLDYVGWDDLVPHQSTDCPCEPMDSEDLLYILYTSGSTGKPKGIVHTTGGYLTGVMATSKLVFDLKPDDLHFCTADLGWVTGHSYIVYGP
ncbi:acetyl-coenzyme A synthetase, partial [bacterium]